MIPAKIRFTARLDELIENGLLVLHRRLHPFPDLLVDISCKWLGKKRFDLHYW